MSKTVALITVHGMGRKGLGYSSALQSKIRANLKPSLWKKVAFREVLYKDILGENQKSVLTASVAAQPGLDNKWLPLRDFMLFGFSDAATLEHHRPDKGGPYTEVQDRIRAALADIWLEVGEKPVKVIIAAHSLGGQVVSNYIWDARQTDPNHQFGTWSHVDRLRDEKTKFEALNSLHRFVTFGCNIPIFVAGHPVIKPFRLDEHDDGDFHWLNFFDRDDVLGWPLEPLSPEYKKLVKDFEISVGGFKDGWNPASHSAYWADDDLVNPLCDEIREALA